MTNVPPPNQQPPMKGSLPFDPIWMRWFDYVGRTLDAVLSTGVVSVNGQTGIVNLDTDDIPQGASNLYDQTVTISEGNKIDVSGSYPNFTIAVNENETTINRNTSNTTISAGNYNWFGNTDAGGFTYTLPAGADNATYRVVNTGTSGNTLTVVPDGSDNLIGSNTGFDLEDGESLIIAYNTTDGWY